ncbi:hypothetical protein [Lihuaxuella thermophila]|uniref:Uncharacterized protein n=1 Tax=Lihuaxuella thermophila TaxID=1173111 RepID=A0A1H8E147_9BACL|nr:hypothetical protein [Lihuaxuella thermophila]SEN13299.1 hypothetical protein SAMN05444955_10683 [Lihuaxuella thermophila]
MSGKKQSKRSDNNGQRLAKVRGGEHRNGRLSQFKNHHPPDQPYPTDYVSNPKE